MAEKVIPYDYLVDYLRSLAALKALWFDARQHAEDALRGFTVTRWVYRPESWPPSYLIAERQGRTEVHIQGTSNFYQVYRHAIGAIGQVYAGGVAHSGWLAAGKEVEHEIRDLLPAFDDRKTLLRIYGHSYGAAVAQVVAWERVWQGQWPLTIRVAAIASPKVFTTWVRQPEWAVELLLNVADSIPYLPPSMLPVMAWDPITGWIPGFTRVDSWTHQGNQQWLYTDGTCTGEGFDDMPPASPGDGVSFTAHFFNAYRDRLLAHGRKQGYTLDVEAQRLLAIFDALDDGATMPRQIPDLSWTEGVPPEPPADRGDFPFFVSKGGGSMANAIKCQIFFRVGMYGFSETHYYVGTSSSAITISNAKRATEAYLGLRATALGEMVRRGVHYEVDAARYSAVGGVKESITDWSVEFDTPKVPPDGSGAGLVEAPFVAKLVRLLAGNTASRNYLLRPVRDTAYLDQKGNRVNDEALTERASALMSGYVAQNVWALRTEVKTQDIEKNVLGISGPPLAAGFYALNVPNHGVSPGQEFAVFGGLPMHRPVRGRYVALDTTTASTIYFKSDKVFEPMPGGCKIRPIIELFAKIDGFIDGRIVSRDTGRPIALGRGRR